MKDAPENGFEAAERGHLESFSRLTPRQKLDWLQQAKEFHRKYRGAAQPKGEGETPPSK